MWRTLMLIFLAMTFLTMIGMEIVRSYVDRARVRRRGMGGTQDIVLVGTAMMFVWLVATVVAYVMCLRTR